MKRENDVDLAQWLLAVAHEPGPKIRSALESGQLEIQGTTQSIS